MPSSSTISPALLEEAADWIITLHFSQPSEADRQAFAQWRATSPSHEAAWTRAEAMRGSFERVSSDVGRQTLHGLHSQDKRHTLRKLGALLVALPAGWIAWRHLPWPQWTADLATGKGERRTVTLDDGSQLTLNGNSAVDVLFTATGRRLMLRAGEILIATHADAITPARPFFVQTPHGTARALGTRFSVRLDADTTRVAVLEHAVEITTLGGRTHIVKDGEQAHFDGEAILETGAADPNASQWQNGMLVARNMRLADVVAELDRHRHGFLRCDPAVADLRISGALSLDDIDASLATLEQSFPLRIRRPHRYWIAVEPRES